MTTKIITQLDFIEYLQGLAEDGETALIVKQKPVMSNGEPQRHADGTVKYTWPSFLPDRLKGGSGGAWYGNTGSFIIDRFTDGKVSAGASNCEYCLVMVLDDIGTKSKVPPLEPTWIIETSADNYQWGYAFSEQPTKGDFTAAIKAIANAGYTDAGATNAVRNFRLPGSVNLKEGKDNFEAKLVEIHPEREYTLEEICTALDVVPSDADTASIRSVQLLDDGDDEVLQWVSDQGMLLENGNQLGWYGIVCPNAGEHTDGNAMARYHPVNRAFCCYHAHCTDFDSKAYLDWVHANGGPKHAPGVRENLLSNVMRAALAKLLPSEMFNKDRVTEQLREIERREMSRIEKDEWWDRFAYVQDDDAYFDLLERREITRNTFNAIYRHINCRSIHTGRKIEAATCFDENRQSHNARAVIGVTYAAGESVLVGREGIAYANRWVDARPDVRDTPIDDISRWSNLVARLIPEESERNHVLDIMAFKLQNPHRKINHAVLHVGDEGCGKDSMWAPFIWSVCGPYLKNRGYMDSDSLHSQWGYDLESEILIINELKEPDAATRRQLANKLKPIIAAPPEMLNINRKGLHPYQMANRLFVLAFSNEQVPISLASQDRRWFCISSSAPRMGNDEGASLWNWYYAGGFAQIAAHLYQRDVSKFNPGATPEMTDFKQNLLESGMSSLESSLVELINNRQSEFARGYISSPLHLVCDRLADLIGMPRTKMPQAALLHALKEAGWCDLGRVGSSNYPNKKRIFASPEATKKYSKSDLRRLVEVEAVPEPKAVVLNMPKRSA